jgi:hypothetical protein
MISYRHDIGAWLNAAEGHARVPVRRGGTLRYALMALEDLWI